jgi:hypothetical protein
MVETHHDGNVDGNAKMPEWLSKSEANTWRMVLYEETWQTIQLFYVHQYSQEAALGGEKGQLREWMAVARDISAWARKVEYIRTYKLLLTNSRIFRH